MTTPGGVPNLPIGALTVETLGDRLQNQTAEGKRARANERMPGTFANSSGGDIAEDLSPFGILTGIFAGVNSLIATADPADIDGPEDLPGLFVDFIESLPIIGPFIDLLNSLLEAFRGEYTGDDELLLAIQDLLAPLLNWLRWIFGGFLNDGENSFLKPVFEWLGFFWELFGEVVESILNPILELVKWAWEKLEQVFGATADQIIRAVVDGIEWVWVNIGEPVVKTIGAIIEFIVSAINPEFFKQLLEDIVGFFTGILSPERFAEIIKVIFSFLGTLFESLNLDAILKLLEDVLAWVISFTLNVIDAGALTLGNLFDGIKNFLAKVPVVGQLLGLAGGDTVNGKPITTLDDLVLWFQTKVLTVDKSIPAKNLFGEIPKVLLSTIGIGQVDDSLPNQVNLNTFPSAEVMQEGGRWYWDGTESTAEGSGSARVTCNAAAARMFSNKIPVSQGQKLALQAQVKWSGLSHVAVLSSPISIGVRTYLNGVVQQQFTPVADIPTLGLSANAGWTLLENVIPWDVPSGVDEVRMAIGVNQSALAGTVWFDDIALRKANKLDQNLVTDIVGALTGVREGLSGANQGTITPGPASATNMYGPASEFRSAFNTEADKGDTLRLNLFGDENTVGTQVQAAAVPSLPQSKISNLEIDLQSRQISIDTLKDSIISGYTVEYPTNNTYWKPPKFRTPTGGELSELYVVCIGGGGKGNNGNAGTDPQQPGLAGGYAAAQIDLDAVPSQVLCTIGGASTTRDPSITRFGDLLSSEDEFRGWVSTPLGLVLTAGKPGRGGRGYGGIGAAPEMGESNGLGMYGGMYGVTGTPAASGQKGIRYLLSLTGGSGGGGGNSAGNGGNGGFPGGGGGGGGLSIGKGGNGAMGLMVVIYKTAEN